MEVCAIQCLCAYIQLVFHSDISLFTYAQWQCMIRLVIVLLPVFSFTCVRFEALVAVQLKVHVVWCDALSYD
jgi:hypothetical protein